MQNRSQTNREKLAEKQSSGALLDRRNRIELTLFTAFEINTNPSGAAFWLMPLAALITAVILGVGSSIWWLRLNNSDKSEKPKLVNKFYSPTAGAIVRNSIGIELVFVPPGTYVMGSSEEEITKAVAEVAKYQPDVQRDRFAHEAPPQKISIADGFWVGKYEVTQAQWRALMQENPSYFKECGANCPVEQISWSDAQAFIKKLNEERDGLEYFLPSEAEWEYAARANTTTTFAYGDGLNSEQANFDGNFPYNSVKGNYIGRTTTVGSYQPNAFGLYDMHGNVWEWTRDVYNASYQNLSTEDSENITAGNPNLLVLRGGSWYNSSSNCRSAFRQKLIFTSRSNHIGFRVAARAK